MKDAPDDRTDHGLEVAIVGMAGRFPRARNLEEFWSNIRNGVHCMTYFSDAELEAAGVATELLHDPSYVKAGPVIDGIEDFDAEFFGYNPREAESIDPQQRLFLECAWQALEDAGYAPGNDNGSVGVYGGVGYNHYHIRNLGVDPDPFDSALGYQSVLGNEKDFLTTRVSYKLGLEGPSVVVQTACSTSLVAVHLACQGLLAGECDLALAGGVTLRVPQIAGYVCQEGGISSSDGHCRAFDAKATGCMPGAGVGVVTLKRLADALADGDSIRAVLKATSINNDGALKVGYTAPRVDGQAKAIATAQMLAHTPAESISYVEAHGTGTALGDPIELAALSQVFRAETDAIGFCALGSVKSNIGHADAAAGVAGLIKTVLALQHAEIPPSVDFESPNPQLDLQNSPFYVSTALHEWPAGAFPRRAGVSSFGLGGANAHVIVEEAPPLPRAPCERPWQLLALSARSEAALRRAGEALGAHLRTHDDIELADAAHTLALGRRAWSHRRIVVARRADEVQQALLEHDTDRVCDGVCDAQEPSVAFMFPGQGAQYVNAGRDLYAHEAVFRHHVGHCAELLEAHLGFDLRQLLFPKPGLEEAAAEELRQTCNTQPALFVIEFALAKLWMAWGIRPSAMIGHSIGEYVAACLAGVISLEDALSLVAARGRILQERPQGAMLAVPLPEAELRALLPADLAVAAVNAPALCVVSGPEGAVSSLEDTLASQGAIGRRLHTSHAFHSHMMDGALPGFKERVEAVTLRPPSIPFVSNVSGAWITAEEATDPGYWTRHLRRCVRFSDGLQVLAEEPGRVLLEVGPGQSLCGLARMQPRDAAPIPAIASLPRPTDDASDAACMLKALGQLWIRGAKVEWSGVHGGEQRRRVPLPTYPFERERFWVEAADIPVPGARARRGTPRKRARIADWFYVPAWSRTAPRASAVSPSDGGPRAWLLLADTAGLAEAIGSRLVARGDTVVIASPGDRFASMPGGGYRIDPSRAEHLESLVSSLSTSDALPDRIVHCCGLTSPALEAGAVPAPLEDLLPDFTCLLALARALGRHHVWKPLRLTVVTNQLFDVIGDEAIHPEKATVIGPCRVIPQEYPNIECRHIDVRLSQGDAAGVALLTDQLLADLDDDADKATVAWRGPHRWVQRFIPFPLGAEDSERPLRLREEGVYVITGGLGGIGLSLAEHLARCARARLVLVGRSTFPEPHEWDAWRGSVDSAQARSSSVGERIAKLQELEAMGARVHVASADVADAARLAAVIARARERFGAIHGVVHAAGVADDGIIQMKEPGDSQAVLAAKLAGTRNLLRCLDQEPLDFVVLCSSLRSILGGKGLVDYCAANAFLDAFAQRSAIAHGPPVVSVNWGAWQSVGMSSQPASQAGRTSGEALTLEDGMTPAEGVEAFARILGGASAQIAVSPQDLPALVAHYAASSGGAHDDQARAAHDATDAAKHARPDLDTPMVAPRNPTETAIAGIWEELLGIERISVHDNFFELGGDSLISLQFVAKASRSGLRLNSKQVFEHQSIAELAAVAGAGQGATVESEPLMGPAPLLPMQQWFFEQRLPNPSHWNLSTLVACREPLDAERLRRAVELVHAHHDALRLRFFESDGEWRQEYVACEDSEVFCRVDLSSMSAERRQRAMQDAAAELQTTLHLSNGPVARVVLFDAGADAPSHLLLILHHLVADVSSWRILLEDLDSAYRQLGDAQPARLPARTNSVKSWSEHLTARAQSPEALAELEFWLAAERSDPPPLELDFPAGENTVGSARTASAYLGAADTRTLQKELHRHNAQMTHALLAAVRHAVRGSTQPAALLVDVEEDGRTMPVEGLDISRTVGWFTVLYPLLVTGSGDARPWSQLLAARDAAARVPSQGLDYGLLRYLNRDADIRTKLRAEPRIAVLYLGRLEGSLSPESMFAFSGQPAGAARNARGRRRHVLEVTAGVEAAGGRLRVDWTYSGQLHREATIDAMADRCVAWLESLCAHLRAPGAAAYTTGDFPGANLSQEQLDALVARIAGNGRR